MLLPNLKCPFKSLCNRIWVTHDGEGGHTRWFQHEFEVLHYSQVAKSQLGLDYKVEMLKKVPLHSTALFPPICYLSRNVPNSFQILLQVIFLLLLFLNPFNMMDTKLGGCWSLLRDVECLHCLVKRVRTWRIAFLGPFQGKMEVIQVSLERKNSHFPYGVNLVQEQSKNMTKVMAV